jgi:uncharacterized RmlC-like cupin family protein
MHHPLTPVESELLSLVADEPQQFAALRDELFERGNDLRSSAVSGLIERLTQRDLLARTSDGRFTLTVTGRSAMATPDITIRESGFCKIRKARPGDGPVLREQGLQREYIIQTAYGIPVSLERVTLCQGEEGIPHAHIDTETVVYTLTGRVLVSSGPDLADVIEVGPEDCLYIPPNEPHYVVNPWPEPMVAVVARFKPQGVIEYPHLRQRALTVGLLPKGVSA